MKTHVDKTVKKKNQSVENGIFRKQNDGESTLEFEDNRPEVVAQRKLQKVMHNSPQVKQLRAIQEMANNSSQTKSKTSRSSPSIQSPIQRVLKKGEKIVSIQEFYADIKKTRPAGGINPHKLPPNRELAKYLYTYYTMVMGRTPVAIGTALRAYWRSLTSGYEYLNKKSKGLNTLKKIFQDKRNLGLVQKIKTGGGDNRLVIFRGTNPIQALRILKNRTLGGQASAGHNLPSPGEEVAKIQTGHNIKETAHGRVEEWSTKDNGLAGFATDGVMLVALVNKRSVATGKAKVGELGATGYAKQPLIAVGIAYIGKRSGIKPAVKLFDAAKKSFHMSQGVKDKTHAPPVRRRKPQNPASYDPSNNFFT